MKLPHLLLIDDAPEVPPVIRILCRRSGHGFSWHVNSASVLDAHRAEGVARPDLLLIDLNLADESGVDTYRRLALPPGPLVGVPAALFTQAPASARLAEAVDAGFEFLVSKDLLAQPEEWKRRIDEIMEWVRSPVLDTPSVRPGESSLTGAQLIGVLRHPVLLRLGEEVLAALLRRALAQGPANDALAGSAVDVNLSPGSLASSLMDLAAVRPNEVASLLTRLHHQVEGLLGRAPAAPLRAALTALQHPNGTPPTV